MKFFNPTSELKELLLLQHIEENPDTTHKEIAKVIGGAPSMVNVYIDNLEEKGQLIREYKSAKVVYYNITPEGIKRKNYLLITYMRELIDLYKLAKSNVEIFLKDVEDKGYKNILLYGAGEVAETIIGVIRDKDNASLNIMGIIDDDIVKQDKMFLNYKVIPRKEIKDYNHDAIIVTSYAFEDDIAKNLDELQYDKDKIIKFFGK
ncbi:MAG: winged helix-turn-helix transcriptional regulator [Firmicutes bacterium]|nr:winged helix-turn-helix transcriptional regulator [Bacillota bacterium]